jgi:hypothetical protein
MSKEKKSPVEEKDDPHRQIVPRVTGIAAQIYTWLEALFEISENDAEPGQVKSGVDSFPQSVQLKMAGRGGVDQGADILSFDFKPMSSALPTREKLVEIANAVVAAAQHDANALGRTMRYGLFAYSTLKGVGAYTRFLFNVDGGASRDAPSDDEDTHRDRFLGSMAAHMRWMTEHYTEATGGVMAMQRDIIRQQQLTVAQYEADRREWIKVSEEALSRKEERERANEWAKFKMEMLQEGLDMLRPLVPVVQAYLTKGKAGLVEGLRKFLDSLSGEQRIKLFGTEDGTDAILTADQRMLILEIADGKQEPKRLAEFATSLSQEQIGLAQEVLTAAQAKQLYGLSQAAMQATQEKPAA